jgi:hypothetical protein
MLEARLHGPGDVRLAQVEPPAPQPGSSLLRDLCPTVRFAGHGRQDGALRERMAWPHWAAPARAGADQRGGSRAA